MKNFAQILKKEVSSEMTKTTVLFTILFIWIFVLSLNMMYLDAKVNGFKYKYAFQRDFNYHLVSSKSAFEDLEKRLNNIESKLALMDIGFTKDDFERSENYINKELKEGTKTSEKCFDEPNHILVYQCLEKELQNLDKRVKEKLPIFKKEAYIHNKNPKFLNYRGEGHIMDVAYNDMMNYRDSFCALKHGAYTLAQWGDVYELECRLIITEDFYNFMVQQIEYGVTQKVWSR